MLSARASLLGAVFLGSAAAFSPLLPAGLRTSLSPRVSPASSSFLPASSRRYTPPSLVTMAAQRGQITVEDVLANPKWPEEWPFSDSDFKRMDETDDEIFYDTPRLVYHIDEGAVAALTEYYAKTIKPKSDILDICSSWVSHFPKVFTETMGRRAGLGMNAAELKENKQLTEFQVQNLNLNSKLPYEDDSFDAVTCVVSVDYLIKPLEVFKEVQRVLRPGGVFIVSQSNRCFATKAIQIWLNTNDLEHVFIIGSYFHYAGGFKPPKALDISPGKPKEGDKNPLASMFGMSMGDPMIIIQGEKA
uniref:Methyltransferase type 11 domain-containing protein n=1 Tax=Hemiselmis tepida TaxID=464990 RepID=A0A7S0Z0W2_9CRYP|mmetsp:Transcript_35855/g.91599  ORF Transcript_35855/g.91599 Transcript_35855/m.91599 type:complete len:303 (-) Transcript_35855:31-939(-)